MEFDVERFPSFRFGKGEYERHLKKQLDRMLAEMETPGDPLSECFQLQELRGFARVLHVRLKDALDKCPLPDNAQRPDDIPDQSRMVYWAFFSCYGAYISIRDNLPAAYVASLVSDFNKQILKLGGICGLIDGGHQITINRDTGGHHRWDSKREKLEARDQKIIQDAKELLRNGKEPHRIKGILAKRNDLTPQRIGQILKEKDPDLARCLKKSEN